MNIILFLTISLSANLFAQEFFEFLSGKPMATSLEVEGIYRPPVAIENGNDKTHVTHESLTFNHPLYQSGNHSLTVGAKYQKLDVSNESPIVDDFYNEQISFGYKRNLPEDKFWMTMLSYGSASDRPFKNGRDSTFSGTFIQKFNSRWFGAVNYSNNRSFLNNIPLPGFFYVKDMSREKLFIIGFPFLLWMKTYPSNWKVKYVGLLPWTHRLRISYTAYKYQPYFGFEQVPLNYFRNQREDRYDRFFWFERRVGLGVEGRLSRKIFFDFSSGFAFDRQFFEARNYSEKKNFLINLDNNWYSSLNLKINF